MMRTGLVFILFATAFARLFAQSPQLGIHVGAGFSHPRISEDDLAYTTTSNWHKGSYNLGATLVLGDQKRVAFAPIVDMDLYRIGYFATVHGNYDLFSDRYVMYCRASPGFRLKVLPWLRLRVGLAVGAMVAATGTYTRTTHFSNGQTNVEDFSDMPREILRPITFGPDMQVVFRISLPNGGALEPALATYFSLNKMQYYRVAVNLNPFIWQTGLQVGYVFGQGHRLR